MQANAPHIYVWAQAMGINVSQGGGVMGNNGYGFFCHVSQAGSAVESCWGRFRRKFWTAFARGCTLGDAYQAAAMSSPTTIENPPGVAPWSSKVLDGWYMAKDNLYWSRLRYSLAVVVWFCCGCHEAPNGFVANSQFQLRARSIEIQSVNSFSFRGDHLSLPPTHQWSRFGAPRVVTNRAEIKRVVEALRTSCSKDWQKGANICGFPRYNRRSHLAKHGNGWNLSI